MAQKFFKKFFLIILFFSFLFSLIASAADINDQSESKKRPVISAKDTLRINRVSSACLSPDGQCVLYTKGIRDMEDKDMKSTTHVWRVRVDGKQRRQMTYGSESCTSPSWFPDGKKIAFLSSRGKAESARDEREGTSERPRNQIYFMYVDGGEAWQVTQHKEGIQSYEISPDSNHILFTARDPLSEEEEKRKKEKDDAEVVDEKFRMNHLWVYDLDEKESSQLTKGEFTVSDAHWSPDSRKIAYVTRPNTKVDEDWNSDIWIVDVETKNYEKLYENPGRDASPRWSPDGKTIAFSSESHASSNTWYSKLYLVAAGGGKPKILLKDFDLNFGTPIWSHDGKRIYWTTGERTTWNLFSVDIRSGNIDKIVPPRGSNSRWRLSKDGKRWIWYHSPSNWPGEIYTAGLNLKNPVRLTDANPWLREENIKLGKVEAIKWKNSDGQWIEGVLTWPVDYKPGKKYPLILNPHGGPSSARIESFSSSNQFFAGNGFMVLQPNFRGSSNYGQEFLNANRGYWGVRDYDDCMTGVDFCIKKGWADSGRLICYGWSYGGYMSFWIVTQTDRFKAVSPGAGLSNLYSMYSTTDIPRYLAWFFGTPWDYEDMYEKLSPIRHVKKVNSPVLIMHGAIDARVPPEQSIEFYQALRDLGKDVTFIRFPRERHGIREPRHQIDRLRRYLFFFADHVNLTPVSEKKEEKHPKKGEKKRDK
jgi:dipeptidyl aminopeptidase/acylaminoacyl peptidase